MYNHQQIRASLWIFNLNFCWSVFPASVLMDSINMCLISYLWWLFLTIKFTSKKTIVNDCYQFFDFTGWQKLCASFLINLCYRCGWLKKLIHHIHSIDISYNWNFHWFHAKWFRLMMKNDWGSLEHWSKFISLQCNGRSILAAPH